MPIGKSSIKRVANNGYSKVSTSAPDMEMSTVASEEKPAPKKPAAAKTARSATTKSTGTGSATRARSTASKPKAPAASSVKPAAEKNPTPEASRAYCNIGEDMPIFLL